MEALAKVRLVRAWYCWPWQACVGRQCQDQRGQGSGLGLGIGLSIGKMPTYTEQEQVPVEEKVTGSPCQALLHSTCAQGRRQFVGLRGPTGGACLGRDRACSLACLCCSLCCGALCAMQWQSLAENGLPSFAPTLGNGRPVQSCQQHTI